MAISESSLKNVWPFKRVLIFGLLSIIGCAPAVYQQMTKVDYKPGHCTTVETRPSYLSTTVSMICLNDEGKVMTSYSGPGKASSDVILGVIDPVVKGAVIGGVGTIISNQLDGAVDVHIK